MFVYMIFTMLFRIISVLGNLEDGHIISQIHLYEQRVPSNKEYTEPRVPSGLKLESSLRMYYYRHLDQVFRYGISMSQMTICRNHNPILLSPFMTCHRILNKSKADATTEPELSTLQDHLLSGIRDPQSFVFSVVFF